MPDKIITAEEIYNIIDHKVSKDFGVNLIENYGLRKQREYIDCIIKESLEKKLNKLNKMLDDLFEKTVEAYKK